MKYKKSLVSVLFLPGNDDIDTKKDYETLIT